MTQPDLFTALIPPCGQCSRLGDAIDSGVRYCRARLVWQWATTRTDCTSRGVKLPPQPDEARQGSQSPDDSRAPGIATDFFAENANNSPNPASKAEGRIP